MGKTKTKMKPATFEKVVGDTATVYRASEGATPRKAQRMLKEAAMEMFPFQEILYLLIHDEKLRRHLTGETFCVSGEMTGDYRTFTINDRKEVELSGSGHLPSEIRVEYRPGDGPLRVYVRNELDTSIHGAALILEGENRNTKSRIVLGKPKRSSRRELAEKKNSVQAVLRHA